MKPAVRFVVVMGIVNLFADMVYEGGRGEVGAFMGSLGASGFVIGVVAGGGELVGYVVRTFSGAIADRTGRYWIDAWAGYLINMLCVPALALAGSWPAAAGLVIGERLGRGIRRPVMSAMIAEAGKSGRSGAGWAFGLNEALDQIGATIGPLIVAFFIARSGDFRPGFGSLIVPACLVFAFLAIAQRLSGPFTPKATRDQAVLKDPALFRRYAIGGALVAIGFVDFALIAFRFQRDHIVSTPDISVWFAVAMAVAAISSYFLGEVFDRLGPVVLVASVILSAAATPLGFLGTGALAQAGAALWGFGTTVQDTLLLALVAKVVGGRRATAFGIFDLVFGVAWFAGSAATGYLADHNVMGLVVLSVVAQLAAIPFFLSKVPG